MASAFGWDQKNLLLAVIHFQTSTSFFTMQGLILLGFQIFANLLRLVAKYEKNVTVIMNKATFIFWSQFLLQRC